MCSSDLSSFLISSNGHNWSLQSDGYLYLPAGGTLGYEGMGWTGLSNGPSGLPVSIVYKTAASNTWQAAVTFTGGDDIDGEGYFIYLYGPYQSVTLISNGTDTWHIV